MAYTSEVSSTVVMNKPFSYDFLYLANLAPTQMGPFQIILSNNLFRCQKNGYFNFLYRNVTHTIQNETFTE